MIIDEGSKRLLRIRVWGLEIRVVRMGPRLILRGRRGRSVERLTRIGWLGRIRKRRVRVIGGRVAGLIGWVRILRLRVIGCGRIILWGR